MTSGDLTVASLGEEGLIEIFAATGAPLGSKVLVGNGDDAAAWFVDPKYASVITTDTLVEGEHFDLAYTPPNMVGRKLMAVNLSDIAAMGARPRYALLSISVPGEVRVDVVQRIAAGIREMCKLHGVAVFGGNVSRIRGPMVLTATIIGRAEPGEIVRRRGTQAGDAIFVTGHLGQARAGLALVQSGWRPARMDPRYPLFEALVDPQPRVLAGRALSRPSLLHAMCDVSDGFGRDLRRMLVPEGLGARIEATSLPISAALRAYAASAGLEPEQLALEGGEDYELLFTADPHDERPIVEACASAGTPVARVGTVTVDPELEVIMPDGSVVPLPSGFTHF